MAKKKRTRETEEEIETQTDTERMPAALKTKLLNLAHQQQIELQQGHDQHRKHATPGAPQAQTRHNGESPDDDSTHAASDDEQELLGAPDFYDDGGNDFELSPNDERAPPTPPP